MRILVLGLLAIVSAAGWGEGWPEELGPFAEIIDDEARFLQEVRRYDKQQNVRASAEWEEGEQLARDGETAQADARKASAKKRLGLVRQAYELGLQRYSENALLHNYYGELLYDRFGEQNSAVREWNAAIMRDSKCSNAHNNLGLHLMHMGMYNKGLNHLERALDLAPDHPDYLYNMAQVLLAHGPQLGKIRGWKPKRVYREAMECSKKAARRAPEDYDLLQDYAVNFFAAENFDTKADWKDAAAAWAAAREQARNDVERFYTWLNEGRAWIRAEKDGEAARCIGEALRLNPESTVAKDLYESVREEASAGEVSKGKKRQSPARRRPFGRGR